MPGISIKKATLINAVSKYTTVVLNIVFTAILSRILTPEDYGVVAIVTVFTTFFTMLANLGFGTGVIQDKTLTEVEINHIFSFTLYVAIGVAILFGFFGFLVAWFYQNRVYIPVCAILSVSLFFNTLNMIPNALLLREKRFLLIGARLIVITITTYGATLALALLGLKYYALAIQSVISALLIFVWNIKNARLKLVLRIDFSGIRKIRSYSGYQFGFNFINYFARNLDNLVIGKVWGNAPLAQYDKAYRFMLYPVSNLTHVITPALHPILSERQDDKDFIYQKYIQVIKLLSVLGVFISVFCFWSSEEIVLLVFGNQWHEAAVCFRWLSLSVWAQMVASSAGAIYQSIGKTKLMFISGLVHVGISVFCILLGIQTGKLEQFSMIIACGFIVKFFVEYCFLVRKGFSKSIIAFLRIFIPEMIMGIVLFLGLFFFSNVLPVSSLSLIVVFVYKLLFSVVVYLLCLMVTGQWKAVKKWLS